MKKFISACAVGIISFLSVAPAAIAWELNANCNEHGRGILSSGYVCVEIVWREQADGQGVTVDTVRVKAMPQGAFENSGNMVDGRYLAIINGNGNVVWSVGDAGSNIGQSGVHSYTMPNDRLRIGTNTAYASYTYKARLNNADDKTGTVERGFG